MAFARIFRRPLSHMNQLVSAFLAFRPRGVDDILRQAACRHRVASLGVLMACIGATVGQPTLASQAGAPDTIFRSGFEALTLVDRLQLQPPRNAVLPAHALPVVGASLESGSVAPAAWRLRLDGGDVTASAVATSTSVLLTPSSPLSEGLHEVGVEVDGVATQWQFTTATPPSVDSYGPTGELPEGTKRPEVIATFSDVGSGIDLERLVLTLDGVDVSNQAVADSGSIRYLPAADLDDAEHVAVLTVVDQAGNQATATWRFSTGVPPLVAFLSPTEELLPAGSLPEVRVEFSVARGALDLSTARFHFNAEDVTANATVAANGPQHATLTYRPDPPLPSGSYPMYAQIRTEAGISGFAMRDVAVDRLHSFDFELVSPGAGSVMLEPNALLRFRAKSTKGAPSSVTVAGSAARHAGADDEWFVFEREVALEPGVNAWESRATFVDGTTRTIPVEVTYDPAPRVTITSPADWSIQGPVVANAGPVPGGAVDLTGNVARPVTVTGTVSTPVVRVHINQQAAQLSADKRSFTFPNFFLHEGTNMLSAVATDARGRSASAEVTLYVDQTAPLLSVEFPTASFTTSEQQVDVRGLVNDAVEGRIGAAQPTVTVTNTTNAQTVAASVGNLGFLAPAVPLEVGVNRLVVIATDALGNARERTIELNRTAVAHARLVVLEGHLQRGAADVELVSPLSVLAVDEEGQPMVGVPVRFDVLRGTGSIRAPMLPQQPDALSPARNLSVATDQDGVARVNLRLGTTAREGSDAVRASILGTPSEVLFIATAEIGAAERIGIFGATGAQYVATDGAPLESLMVQVLDGHENPVADAMVEYTVEEGSVFFEAGSASAGVVGNGGKSITVTTDRNGLATVRPRAGRTEENAKVRAVGFRQDGTSFGGPVFQLAVLPRRDVPTTLSGVALDHSGVPLAGIRMSLARTALSVVTDAEGFFQFENQVPSGKVDVFVDGRDVRFTRGNEEFEYPALHFETTVVQGQDNPMPHPIYLPPVEISRAVNVGGSDDVVLTMPGFEGFEMRVRANSVTFPDGSREGPLVVSPVHADRLPMVPPALGARFSAVGWTIQPTGTRFDPPIEVKIPNADGFLPGRTVPIFQWDHDLALFVPMGMGTVSEDGSQVVSDTGSGITKAGWGGPAPPPPENDACGPDPVCYACEEMAQTVTRCPVCRTKTRAQVALDVSIVRPSEPIEMLTDSSDESREILSVEVTGLQGSAFDWDVRSHNKRTVKANVVMACGSQSYSLDFSSNGGRFSVTPRDTDLGIFKGLTGAPPDAAGGIDILPELNPGMFVTTQHGVGDAAAAIFVCGHKFADPVKVEIQNVKFIARNPEVQTVKDYISAIESDPLHASVLTHFACHEPDVGGAGKYKHFNISGTNNALPVLNNSLDGGFGMMQVTDANRRSCPALWDWRENVREAREIFYEKLGTPTTPDTAASTHTQESGRSAAQDLQSCLVATGQNWNAVAPPLTPEQLMLETIRRFNGGRQYEFILTNPDGSQNFGPYTAASDCTQGEWRRRTALNSSQNPAYVREVCECDGPILGTICPTEP